MQDLLSTLLLPLGWPWLAPQTTLSVCQCLKLGLVRGRTKSKFITEEESSKMESTTLFSCVFRWSCLAFCIKWFINQQIHYYYLASRGRTLATPPDLICPGFTWENFSDDDDVWSGLVWCGGGPEGGGFDGNPNWDIFYTERRTRWRKWLLECAALTCFNQITICR